MDQLELLLNTEYRYNLTCLQRLVWCCGTNIRLQGVFFSVFLCHLIFDCFVNRRQCFTYYLVKVEPRELNLYYLYISRSTVDLPMIPNITISFNYCHIVYYEINLPIILSTNLFLLFWKHNQSLERSLKIKSARQHALIKNSFGVNSVTLLICFKLVPES